MTKNLSVCATCEADLETTDADEHQDGIIQTMKQHCNDCNTDVMIGVLNYPNMSYTVFGPALPDDDCSQCDNDAFLRAQSTGENVRGICQDHLMEIHRTILDYMNDLA